MYAKFSSRVYEHACTGHPRLIENSHTLDHCRISALLGVPSPWIRMCHNAAASDKRFCELAVPLFCCYPTSRASVYAKAAKVAHERMNARTFSAATDLVALA
jgi:hypothetical protein